MFAWANSNGVFTLLATSTSDPVILSEGQPQAGEALPHSMAYFSFNSSYASKGIDVFAVPIGGSVEVYADPIFVPVPVCSFPNPAGGCSYWGALCGLPQRSCRYSSIGSALGGFLSVPSGALTDGSGINIAVLATTPDGVNGLPPPPSVFAVTASSRAATVTMQAGVPVPGTILGSTPPALSAPPRAYSFALSVNGSDVVVVADVVGGLADMYAYEGPAPPSNTSIFPGRSASTWNASALSAASRSRFLLVPYAGLSLACQTALASGTGGCSIVIVVMSLQSATTASYFLTTSSAGSPSSAVLLPDGEPQFLVVPRLTCAYLYAFADAPPGGSLYIVVNNLFGTSTLYVNLGTSGKGFWTPSGAFAPDYASADAGGFERVIIRPPQFNADAPLGVLAIPLERDAATGIVHVRSMEGAPADARVVASLPGGGAVLQVRLPSPAGETRVVYDGGRQTLALPAHGPVARRLGANWASADAPPALPADAYAPVSANEHHALRSLQAPPSRPFCNNCEIYVSVLAGPFDVYALVDFHTGERVTALVADTPAYGSVGPPAGFAYYSFAVTDPAANVVFSASTIFGGILVSILLENPATPWILPTAAPGGATWSWAPSVFSPTYQISANSICSGMVRRWLKANLLLTSRSPPSPFPSSRATTSFS